MSTNPVSLLTSRSARHSTNISQDTKEINGTNGTSGTDHAALPPKQRVPYDYGGNPLAHIATNDPSMRLPAFGGEFQPGLYRAPKKDFANPAPLGLSAFALTTFVLSLINMGTRGIAHPNIVVALAYGYGGLVQLLAGMWEMAVGNTFGATALSSYGGFWISFAIILTPGGFNIVSTLEDTTEGGSDAMFLNSFGLYLMVSSKTTRDPRSAFANQSPVGLVHLHLHPAHLYSALDCGFLLPLLHARLCLPHAGYRLPEARRQRAPRRAHQGRWCVWYSGCLRRLVQCPCRYRRLEQQVCSPPYAYLDRDQLTDTPEKLLRHSRCPLPLVRQRPRETRQGQQQRCACRAGCLDQTTQTSLS